MFCEKIYKRDLLPDPVLYILMCLLRRWTFRMESITNIEIDLHLYSILTLKYPLLAFKYNIHAGNEFSGINLHEIDMSHVYAYKSMKAVWLQINTRDSFGDMTFT